MSDAGARATLQAAREALLLQVKKVKKVKLEDKYKRKYGKVRFFGAPRRRLGSSARATLAQTLTPSCAAVSRAEAYPEGPQKAAGGDRGAGLGALTCCGSLSTACPDAVT